MKFTNVFTFILLVHALGVGALLLVQSGCHQSSFEVREADISAPIVAPKKQTPPYEEALDRIDQETHAFDTPTHTGRFAPQRPIIEAPELNEEDEEPEENEESIDAVILSTPPQALVDPARVALRTPQPQASQSMPASLHPECIHIVQAGDSLWKIANHYKISLAQLLDFNKHQGLTRDSLIRPGQQIVTGSLDKNAPAQQAPSVAKTIPSAPAPHAATSTYRIRGGDTLTKIARRHSITVPELKALNGLSSDTIRIGQELKVKATNTTTTTPFLAPATIPSAAGPAPSQPTGNPSGLHTVAAGETASDIAKRYHVKISDLLLANSISDPRKLQVGQRLTIPSSEVPTVAAVQKEAPSVPSLDAPIKESAMGAIEETFPFDEEEDLSLDDDMDDDMDDDDDGVFDSLEATPLVPVPLSSR